MKGESYYLILIHKDGTKYRVFNKPISLKTMDERTTKYNNKNELVNEIIKNKNLSFNVGDIIDVEIYMKPNQNKEEYKKEKGPLYKKDYMVLNKDAVVSKYELLIHDRKFVKELVKKYKGIKNFLPLCKSIEESINNDELYMDYLEILSQRLLSTYKGTRNIYLLMKKYQNKKSKVNIDEYDKKEALIRYLNQYERELLDIDDLTHYEDLSLFDAHKKK